ncbi:hexosaminidase [Microbacterium endophyticum]|uniref:beta-N-acetylhexosaminidase n=1 Tax=Microbacterium endophyticum TaxID=1526412 RepID=A0A7W4YN19_9MICO|nr:beta-N-acetylhexosaminidase [Microbacterium endophyticum]MBB2975667.1 hexosaminidase [Microbacterium endophyticum]NIK35314.1 hexosaminidase [Microbacterium endophyticum]
MTRHPAVVPAPAMMHAGDGTFLLGAGVVVGGEAAASALCTELLAQRTGLSLEAGANAQISCTLIDDGEPESYRLRVTPEGARLEAPDAAGLFYGVHTLAQLVARHDGEWILPAVEITDAPRFEYRGVMLDVARHFHGVDTVKGYIDRASALKFNVLHLHLTDDQGWRLELSSRPELTGSGSGTSVGDKPGGYFSAGDYRDIVAYAAAHHMTVVPEFDVPGHTHAVGLGYPELAAPPAASEAVDDAVAEFGGGMPTPGVPYIGLAVGFSSLIIDSAATDEFLADVFGELATMTPGPYLHVGGDEALGTPPADFAAFMARVTTLVAQLGKTPIAWHEAGAAPGIAPSTVGQYWGFVTPTADSAEKARAFVTHGSRLILSPADAVYLDMKENDSDRLGLTWANGPTSLERSYRWEPTSIIDGIGEDAILGVEAPLWTETIVNAADIDAAAFPRIASAAEAAWSQPEQRDWESFVVRVGRLGPLWTRAGIAFTPLPAVQWAHDEE